MKIGNDVFLVCPLTKEKLTLIIKEKNNDEIVEGVLKTSSRNIYNIKNGIPRFISITQDVNQKKTGSQFSSKWKTVPMFGHEKESKKFYNKWFLQRYGFKTETNLKAFLNKKKFILDAGTGLGRDSTWYARLSDAKVFGLDIADTIDIAKRGSPNNIENLTFIQGDLTKLPFSYGFFDFIVCDQVMHHTKNTFNSFHHLAKHLLPGGHIAIYVYKIKSPIRELADNYLRKYLTKCSEDECWKFSQAITDIGKQLTEINATIKIKEDIPLLGIEKGEHNLQRLIYWNFIKCYWNPKFNEDINVSHNFDWYRPIYAHRHAPREVKGWFEKENLIVDHFDVVESGISVLGHKRY